MKRVFIKVETLNNSHHIIPVDMIHSVIPRNGWNTKSAIRFIDGKPECYSTETPEEIYAKIENHKPPEPNRKIPKPAPNNQ